MHGNPIVAADHVNRLAKNTKDDRVAMALTVMSCALVATMLIKEFRGLFKDNEGHPHLHPNDRGRG